MGIIDKVKLHRDGNAVQRLHVVRHLMPYTNGQHSANAALLAIELCRLNRLPIASVVEYMLLHDLAEGYTGDMPANVKWENPQLAAALTTTEERWCRAHGLELPDLSNEEAAICKFADMAELGLYCAEELTLGNRHVLPVMVRVLEALNCRKGNIIGAQDIIDYITAWGNTSEK
jgi:5'-deoxynucleotidase YfbR-like HD superfamily hydrolase